MVASAVEGGSYQVSRAGSEPNLCNTVAVQQISCQSNANKMGRFESNEDSLVFIAMQEFEFGRPSQH